MFRIRKIAAAAAAAALLFGCAHPQMVDIGSSEEEVVARLGAPDSSAVLPDGTKRLVFSMQPAGQECWWMHFRDGRLVGMEQALTEKNFAAVHHGMKASEVRALFGKPAKVYEFRLQREEALFYRFQDAVMNNMAFWAQYDANGIVTDTAITKDPWLDSKFPFY